MTNPSTQDNSEVTPMYDDEMIIGLFNNFLAEGGDPKVTAFKRHLDQLINAKVKPLCGGKGKASGDGGWRSELKARFSGRGAKWVKVSIEEIGSTLVSLGDAEDVRDYVSWISAAGFAWIRFSGPRVHGGENCAAFEVRTSGSTIDHPRQLHYVPVAMLDDKIEVLGGTPHAMKLEEVAKPSDEKEVDVEVDETVVPEVEADVEEVFYDDLMSDEVGFDDDEDFDAAF